MSIAFKIQKINQCLSLFVQKFLNHISSHSRRYLKKEIEAFIIIQFIRIITIIIIFIYIFDKILRIVEKRCRLR